MANYSPHHYPFSSHSYYDHFQEFQTHSNLKKLTFLAMFQVSSPLLILHGAADKVTDPLVSQFLYNKASSNDKTLKLYEGGYHGILEGEPDHVILTVLGDIISWLDHRCSHK